jgi:hypothetical protein
MEFGKASFWLLSNGWLLLPIAAADIFLGPSRQVIGSKTGLAAQQLDGADPASCGESGLR